MVCEERQFPLELLKERLRMGLLTVEIVKQASRLGHPLARSLFPNEILVDWADRGKRKELLGLLGNLTCVRFAVDCAEKVLPLFEAKHPNDGRPRKAIEAAKTWLKDSNEENRKAVDKAADDAVKAAYAAAYAAATAAYAAATDAYTAYTTDYTDFTAAAAANATATTAGGEEARVEEYKRQKTALARMILE